MLSLSGAVGKLMRFPAVVVSSYSGMLIGLGAAVGIRGISLPWGEVGLLFLAVGLLHGVTAHASNDLNDYLSGTDAKSPGILSGGSGVLTEGILKLRDVRLIRNASLFPVGLIAAYFALRVGTPALGLIAVGLWSALSYTEPPLRLAYRPVLGEWLGEFPGMVGASVGVVLVLAGHVTVAAWSGAILNALFCMGWLMQHHLPDLEADLKAVPRKLTTVAYFYDRTGTRHVRLPAVVYFTLAAICAVWGVMTVHRAFLVSSVLALMCCYLAATSPVEDVGAVTRRLKAMEAATLINALVLAISFTISL
jgi:1,4-dihydroxy-2-naphthoate octaprenyltransferase